MNYSKVDYLDSTSFSLYYIIKKNSSLL